MQVIEFIYNYITIGTDIITVELWLPFGHDTDFKYLITCFSIVISALNSSSSLFIFDFTLYTLITIIALNFNMVGCEMREILNKSKTKIKDLEQVVNFHTKLIDICNQIESIISKNLLHNYLQGIAVICLLCFQLVVLKDLSQLAVYGIVLTIALFQCFMITFHGQMMIDSSSKIAEYVYDSEWYLLEDKRVKKSIVSLMMVAQIPKSLTAGGFLRVSMEMFTMVRTFFDYNLL